MIPECGHFAIIFALCFALIQCLSPILGYRRKQTIYFDLSVTAVIGQFAALGFAMLCLIASFINNDMSVLFVQEHSHRLLPLLYRIGAAWGGHEGSLLLWCLILSGWTVAVALFYKCPNTELKWRGIFPKIIATLGILNTGFIIFLLTTSDPFLRIFPTTLINGDDLTPVLQDPGLIFHPPMLYLGYVGFAVAFAFAISALIEGKLDNNWARAVRPWIILPWSFLSCGIVLGSWWAYRELGWGGWWFWDPVENASLLPWLCATALIHALIVSEKRDAFKGWTLLLAILTFAFSLLGTFLVRSGVLVSVHAFASDPTRGLFLLCYLALIIGGALIFYSCRIKHFYQPPKFELFSRETLLLMNSVILLTAVATISIGTLYPIILDALNAGKISVGEPYFNTIFIPMMLPLLLLMGFAPHVNWHEQAVKKIWRKLQLDLIISATLGMIGPWIFGFEFRWLTATGIAIAIWIMLATLHSILSSRKFSTLPMVIAHLGIAILALGITVNKSYSEERQVKMHLGESVTLAGYQFTFKNIEKTHGQNYQSMTAQFDIQHNKTLTTLFAEQRIYTSHEQTLSQPGISFNAWRDLYLALGSELPDGSWSIRLYYKPLVRWIWGGGLLLLLGGLLSLFTHTKKRENA